MITRPSMASAKLFLPTLNQGSPLVVTSCAPGRARERRRRSSIVAMTASQSLLGGERLGVDVLAEHAREHHVDVLEVVAQVEELLELGVRQRDLGIGLQEVE